MTRIGILGINDLTEIFLTELFRLDSYAHVFLSAEDSEHANRLARKFPCWIQDNGQDVVNEADIILITRDTVRTGNIYEKLEYRQTQLVLCLNTQSFAKSETITSKKCKKTNSIHRHITLKNLSPYLRLTDEEVDDFFFVLRVLLISMQPIHSLEVNIRASSRSAAPQDPE